MKGRVLAGRFRLTEMLGQGGMGSVWRATHLELGTDIAVKLMDPSLATSDEGVARFRREAQAAASLHSPNVVQVFDYGVDGDTPYIAMEMLQGESLAKRIERYRRLPPMAMATILSQVARALGKAHDAGIVHRDLKPENIFLVVDEDIEAAKVLDFGIAKRTNFDSMMTGSMQTQTGAMLGTPYYMSPEQAAGKKDIDHRSDIWSFGVIACECLIGKHVFDADTLGGLVLAICTESIPSPSRLGPVPPQFDAWFARCVARDRQARFQSIREAAAALEAVCREGIDGHSPLSRGPISGVAGASSSTRAVWQAPAGGLSDSTQTGPTSITVHQARSAHRMRLTGIGIGAAVLLGGVALFFWLGQSAPVASPASSAIAAPSLNELKPAQVAQPHPSEVTPTVEPVPVAAASALQTGEPSPMAAADDGGQKPGPHRVNPHSLAAPTRSSSAAAAPPPPAAPLLQTAPPPPAAPLPQTAPPPPAAPPAQPDPSPPVASARPSARPNPVDLAF